MIWPVGARLLSSSVPDAASGALLRVPIVQRPRTWPFQGQNTGSNPVGDVPNPPAICLGQRAMRLDPYRSERLAIASALQSSAFATSNSAVRPRSPSINA